MKRSFKTIIIAICIPSALLPFGILVYFLHLSGVFAPIILKYKLSKYDNVKLLEWRGIEVAEMIEKIEIKKGSKSILLELHQSEDFDFFEILSINGKILVSKKNESYTVIHKDNGKKFLHWDIHNSGIYFRENSEYNELLKLHITTLEDVIDNVFVIDSFLNSLPEYPKEYKPRYYTNDSTFEIYYVMTKLKYGDTAYKHFGNDTTLKFKFHDQPVR